jgi:hypothetical protein
MPTAVRIKNGMDGADDKIFESDISSFLRFAAPRTRTLPSSFLSTKSSEISAKFDEAGRECRNQSRFATWTRSMLTSPYPSLELRFAEVASLR